LFHAWAQLIRLPNVFTVLADVSAAFLLVHQGPTPISRFILIVLAGVALYWAGMILNDIFDVEQDRKQRPRRPIPAGLIPLGQAKTVGWLLLLAGIGFATAAGRIPADGVPLTWLPAVVGLALAVMIVAYDGPLKKTPLAPVAMGGCRVLSFLLGASPCFAIVAGTPLFEKYIWGIAVGFGIFIMGITTMARREATGGPSSNLQIGLMITALGAGVLAFAPQLNANQAGWKIQTDSLFPLMIGMIALPVVMRGFRAVQDPTPIKIQTAIRVGIFTIIPLAASYAFLGAGPAWGLAVFGLTIPSLYLSLRFRVT
jgi:4-hydroxybenzoate polyprenyltransferase